MTDNNQSTYKNWIGKSETLIDEITVPPIWGFYDVLDQNKKPENGDIIPYGSHWCFFLPHVPMKEVGPDGHPKRGGFMPDPKGLPRRMFAGSRLSFVKEIKIGDQVTKHQEISSVTEKIGKSGQLVFVKVKETYSTNGSPAIFQENDIVYRGPPDPSAQRSHTAKKSNNKPSWKETIKPDPVMLFKYSAITFNGHRIHYDRHYTTLEEGYPGLVVHGPLTATLLMNFCVNKINSKQLNYFSFRAIAPLFDIEPFTLNAVPKEKNENIWILWAENSNGEMCMTAEASFN
tara:strand:+ start:77 stop:940 length:864 start_codon:yes stop_codon:yes gene_type:complete